MTAQNVKYPSSLTLQWREVAGANRYVIKQYDDDWKIIAEIKDTSRGYYKYITPYIDGNTQWQIIAVDEYKNESAPLGYEALTVRNPDVPDISIAYDTANTTFKIEGSA